MLKFWQARAALSIRLIFLFRLYLNLSSLVRKQAPEEKD